MPEVTLVIPTFRRHEVLRRVLDLLERQTTGPGAFEVVVVVDDREDDPRPTAEVVGSRPYRARWVAREAPGVSAARNRGWRDARAPLVLFLGDDMLPAHDLVAEHLSWHECEPSPAVGVLGHVEWAGELRITPFMRWLDQGMQFDYRTITGTEAQWWHFYTANASVKRALLEQVGGFDEGFPFGYEDLDIARRMHDHGFTLRYNPAARCEHLHRPTVDEWRRRMAQVAAAERRFVGKYPDLEPYFLRRFEGVAGEPRPQGAGGRLEALAPRLAALVPRRVPWLGPRIWRRTESIYRRELAPAFLDAWQQAGASARV